MDISSLCHTIQDPLSSPSFLMPSVAQLLNLFESLGRKDWNELVETAHTIAASERKKKHYNASKKIIDAASVISKQFLHEDNLGITPQLHEAPPIDLLVKNDCIEKTPQLPKWLEAELEGFLLEWAKENVLRKAGLSPRNTILMHGPPGCGKTLLANYIAQKMGVDVYTVRFDALVSSYLGETGGNIRKIFQFAKNNKCVLFLDEIDAIAKLRDDQSEVGELKRVVIALLQNIDELPTGTVLIAATNHPHMLDKALWRRFDIAWEIQQPSDNQRMKLLRSLWPQNTEKKPPNTNIVEATNMMSYAEITNVMLAAKRKTILYKDFDFEEAVYVSLIEFSKRGESARINSDQDQRLAKVVGFLRIYKKKKYTFSKLEEMTGISHSTLHHRVSVLDNV